MIKEVCVDADKVTPVEFVETVFKGVLEAGAGLAIDTLSNLGSSIVVSYDNKKHYDLYTQFSFMSKTYYDTYTMANSVIDITGIKNNGDNYFNPLLLPYFSTLAWNDLKFSQKIASYQDDIVDLILNVGFAKAAKLGFSALKSAFTRQGRQALKQSGKASLEAVGEFGALSVTGATISASFIITSANGKALDAWLEQFNDPSIMGRAEKVINYIYETGKELVIDIAKSTKQAIKNITYKTFGSPVNTTLAYFVTDSNMNQLVLDTSMQYIIKNDIRLRVYETFKWISISAMKENVDEESYFKVLKNLKETDNAQYRICINGIFNDKNISNGYITILANYLKNTNNIVPGDITRFLESNNLKELIEHTLKQWDFFEKIKKDKDFSKKTYKETIADEKTANFVKAMDTMYSKSIDEMKLDGTKANDYAFFRKINLIHSMPTQNLKAQRVSEYFHPQGATQAAISRTRQVNNVGLGASDDAIIAAQESEILYKKGEITKEQLDERKQSNYYNFSLVTTTTNNTSPKPVNIQTANQNVVKTTGGNTQIDKQLSKQSKPLLEQPIALQKNGKIGAKFKEAGIGQYYTTEKINLEGLEGYDPSINYFNYTGTLENEKVALGGLDPNLRSNLNAMGYEFFVKFNRKFNLTSAFRSYATQEKLWKDYKAGKGNPANRPGYSLHEFGLAVDILSSDAALLDNSGLLKKWGFWRPLAPNPEAWHIQPISIKQKNGDGQVEVQEEKIEKNLEEKGEIESLEEKYNNIVNDPNVSKTEKEVAEKKLKELENKKVVEQGKTPPTIVTESISGIDPTLINHIKAHEGFRENIYVENFAGKPNPTVGYGFLVSALTADELALNGGKAEPMSKEVAEKILTLKVSKLVKNMDKYGKLGEVYKKAPQQIKNFLVDFAYSIGPAGANGFPRMLAAIEKGDYQTAINELKYSDPNTKTPSKISQQVSSIMFNNWISVLAGQKTYADLKMIKEDGKTLPKVANVDTTSPNVKTEGINSLPKVANVDTTSPNVKVSEPTTIFSGEVGESVEQVYSQVADELGLNKTAIETLKIEEIKEEVYRDTIKKKVNNVKQKVNSDTIKKSSATTPLVRTSDGNYVFNKNAKLGLDTKTGSLTFSDIKDYNSVNTAFENNIQKEMEQAISEYNVSDLHLGSSNTNVQQVIDDNTNFYKSQYEDLSSTQENIQVQNIQKISENNTLNKYKEVSQGFNNGATNASILDGLLPFDATNESERINA